MLRHLPLLGALSTLAAAVTLAPRAWPRTDTEASGEPTLAWADFDRDGFVDLLAIRPGGELTLHRAERDGGFRDVTVEQGLGDLRDLRAAHWADADGDGWPDLSVVWADGRLRLMSNRAGGGFDDVTESSGCLGEGVLSATWTDFDGDERADLVLRTAGGPVLQRNLGHLRFEQLELWDTRTAHVLVPETASRPAIAGATEVEVPDAESHPTGTSDTQRRTASRASLGNPTPIAATADVSTPTPQPLQLGPLACALSIRDASSGQCLTADTQPTLGSLYPITSNLYVDGLTGYVGMGTTRPAARLDVRSSVASAPALFAQQTAEGHAAVLMSDATTSPALRVFSGGTAAELEGLVHVGSRSSRLGNLLPAVTLGSNGNLAGEITLLDAVSRERIELDANNASDSATLRMRDANGTTTVSANSSFNGAGATLSLRKTNGVTGIELQAKDPQTTGAQLFMRSSQNVQTVEIISEEVPGNGAQIALGLANGTNTIVLDAESGSTAGEFSMRMRDGTETVEIRSEEVAGNGAQILLRKSDGSVGIVLDAEQGGEARITCDVLEITGGADLVESFETGGEACATGTVLVIDPERAGQLTPAESSYDRRVAGVVSGAGGLNPGLHMRQEGVAEGDTPVALTGRVYVRCSGENGAIRPGDLLTTSATRGHAMRASDPERAFGAVLGKAMGSLADGELGLVLVLVGLQ